MPKNTTKKPSANAPLFNQIKNLIESAKVKIAVSVNSEVAFLNWKIGCVIAEEILQNKRAAYGKEIIGNLSVNLITEFGDGWSEKHLRHCLRSAENFSEKQIVSALRRQLSWTHIKAISYENDQLKRDFYLEMAIAERWSTRDLQEKMGSMLFERTALSKKPKTLAKQELKKLSADKIISPDLVFKDTYVLDFLGLKDSYSEKDLENSIVVNIEKFLLEIGDGFAFIERQKRIAVDDIDYYLDLLFYHRKLKRLVAVDLKLGKFKPEYKGQMELYLRWLQKYEKQEDEENPIGLLLCSEGNSEHIEFMMIDQKEIRVAQYLTQLPSRKWLESKLHKAVEIAKRNHSKYENIRQ
jgi:predicted nuclease of restriction endonuclease-like (RecB) superfamily